MSLVVSPTTSADGRARRAVRIICGVWVALLLAWSVLLPTYRSADEVNHMSAAIALSETDSWPGYKRLFHVDQVVDTLEAAGYRAHPPRGVGNYYPLPADGAEPRETRQPFLHPGEAVTLLHVNGIGQHPPGYYGLLALVDRALPADTPYTTTVWMFRLVSVLLMAPLPWLLAATARRLGADPPAVVVMAVVPFLIPQLGALGGAVNNDNLLIVACAVVAWLSTRIATGDLAGERPSGPGSRSPPPCSPRPSVWSSCPCSSRPTCSPPCEHGRGVCPRSVCSRPGAWRCSVPGGGCATSWSSGSCSRPATWPASTCPSIPARPSTTICWPRGTSSRCGSGRPCRSSPARLSRRQSPRCSRSRCSRRWSCSSCAGGPSSPGGPTRCCSWRRSSCAPWSSSRRPGSCSWPRVFREVCRVGTSSPGSPASRPPSVSASWPPSRSGPGDLWPSWLPCAERSSSACRSHGCSGSTTQVRRGALACSRCPSGARCRRCSPP